eukprot:CAMPEP_0172450132 /NCGR_PEP_ID=MMETSP1065-20121228/8613_1 /TAXON_ID=265537 /ORGANISM="Amphiprora paludosa, Strain CCMP125" /LENGTH=237 /DNA_ID=CAMNT_0013201905 /DNA_START=26 /DNA_END=736 /DNA_ORIENTATION=-
MRFAAIVAILFSIQKHALAEPDEQRRVSAERMTAYWPGKKGGYGGSMSSKSSGKRSYTKTRHPTYTPTYFPTNDPTISQSPSVSMTPTESPTVTPTLMPTIAPTTSSPTVSAAPTKCIRYGSKSAKTSRSGGMGKEKGSKSDYLYGHQPHEIASPAFYSAGHPDPKGKKRKLPAVWCPPEEEEHPVPHQPGDPHQYYYDEEGDFYYYYEPYFSRSKKVKESHEKSQQPRDPATKGYW